MVAISVAFHVVSADRPWRRLPLRPSLGVEVGRNGFEPSRPQGCGAVRRCRRPSTGRAAMCSTFDFGACLNPVATKGRMAEEPSPTRTRFRDPPAMPGAVDRREPGAGSAGARNASTKRPARIGHFGGVRGRARPAPCLASRPRRRSTPLGTASPDVSCEERFDHEPRSIDGEAALAHLLQQAGVLDLALHEGDVGGASRSSRRARRRNSAGRTGRPPAPRR